MKDELDALKAYLDASAEIWREHGSGDYGTEMAEKFKRWAALVASIEVQLVVKDTQA